MPRIVLATLNARYIHASLGLRYLLANMGELERETEIASAARDIQRTSGASCACRDAIHQLLFPDGIHTE